MKAVGALERIDEFNIDWAKSTAENVVQLQSLASEALQAIRTMVPLRDDEKLRNALYRELFAAATDPQDWFEQGRIDERRTRKLTHVLDAIQAAIFPAGGTTETKED